MLISVLGSIRELVINVAALSESRVIPATIQLQLTVINGSSRHV